MQKLKSKTRHRLGNMAIALFLLFFAFLCIYPVIYILLASFSDPTQLSLHKGVLWHTLGFGVRGYELLLHNVPILQGYANSLFVMAVGTFLNVAVSLLAAYVLSREKLYIHKALNKMVVFTMYFSGGMIPLFLVVKSIGLLNSRWSLILPVLLNTYNVIILKTAIQGLPASLLDAARVDGVNDITLLTRIVTPLVRPALAVLVMYYAVDHWNSWFNAMVYIQSREKYPLQLLIREVLLGANTISSGMDADVDKYATLTRYCASVLGALPVLVLFPFLQKYFVSGIMMGAVKE